MSLYLYVSPIVIQPHNTVTYIKIKTNNKLSINLSDIFFVVDKEEESLSILKINKNKFLIYV